MKTQKPVIIMDLGGVYFTEGKKIAVKKISKKYRIPEEEIDNALKGDHSQDYRMGKIKAEDFWDIVAKKLGLSQKQIKDVEHAWHSSYKPQRGMPGIVKRLKKNYRTVILSGNTPERVKFLNKKYRMLANFHDHHFSFDYGFVKPDIRFFEKALKKMKVEAENCIVIDDVTDFLEAVKSRGARTVFFENPEQLKGELRKLGVKI